MVAASVAASPVAAAPMAAAPVAASAVAAAPMDHAPQRRLPLLLHLWCYSRGCTVHTLRNCYVTAAPLVASVAATP
jgi:hypothetical protein